MKKTEVRSQESEVAVDPFAPVIKAVMVPGRPAPFYVREFDVAGAETYRQFRITLAAQRDAAPDPAKFQAAGLSETILALSVCDATGRLLFTKEQLADYRQKAARVFDLLLTAACHVNLIFGASETEVAQMQEFFTRAQPRKAGPGSPGTSGNPTSARSKEESAKPGLSTGSPG